MTADFSDLACPFCQSGLQQSPDMLICEKHGSFPIRDRIAEFSSDTSFDAHWVGVSQRTIPNAKLAVAEAFLSPLLAQRNANYQMRILDIGCGDGVHATVLARHGLIGGYTGVDVSRDALRAAQSRTGDDGRFIRADAVSLPFRSCSFDAIIAFGIIEYVDTRPQDILAKLCELLAPGGLIGIWMLEPSDNFPIRILSLLRRLSDRHPNLRKILANIIVPMLGFIGTKSGVSLQNASWAQCRETVLVNLAAPTLSLLAKFEILNVLGAHSLQIVQDDHPAPITIWAQRPQSAAASGG